MENLPQEMIQNSIYDICNLKVMLDSDLATLYEVETKRINEAVKNNPDKFPEDFYFELTDEEFETLRSKFSTFRNSLNSRKYNVKVFTEQGVYMWNSLKQSELLYFVRVETEDDIPKVSS